MDELKGRAVIVYDLESKIAFQPGERWELERMGISVGCAFDYMSGDYFVFLEDNLPDLVRMLNAAELVVAFNQIGFDNKLLRASGLGLNPDELMMNYDMLQESRTAMGYQPGDKYPSGLKLDHHLEATFGKDFMKTGDGLEAPRLYQERKMGQLISYCLADVRREKMLFEHIMKVGYVDTFAHGCRKMRDPRSLLVNL